MTKHCRKCELPKKICACAEAEAYDKANPLCDHNYITITMSSFRLVPYLKCSKCGDIKDIHDGKS